MTAVDALGNSSVYKYEYDEQDRLIKETDYEGRRTEYSEFDNTNIAQKIEKYTSDGVLYYTVTDDKTNGATISGGDSVTEIKTKTETIEGATGYENDSIIKNTVDAGGYIVSNIRDVKDESKHEIVSVYDSENKLIIEIMNSISDANVKNVIYRKEYTYYESGLKHTFMIFDGNGNTMYGLRYKYNGGGVESIQEIHNRTTAPATDDTTISDYETYEYNGDSTLLQKTNDKFTTSYTYNLAGMVSSQYTLNVDNSVAPITSSYNNYCNDGKVYQSGDSFIGTYRTYEYNAYGDLAKETNNGTEITEYQHDSKYNINYRKQYSTTETAYSEDGYSYINNGDQNYYVYHLEYAEPDSQPTYTVTKGNLFDAMGNETLCQSLGSSSGTTFDLESKMITSTGGMILYSYDPNGMMYRRVGRVQNSDGSYTYFDDTRYIYDENGQVVLEINDTANTMIKYVRSADGQISKTIDKDNNVINYYAYNTHGDVCRITDATGAVTGTYIYDVYGGLKSSSGAAVGNNYMRYCGEYYDKYSGCYYLRARFYNPVTMRFKQADTYLGYVGDPASRNLYAYCGNDPVNYNDPTGHWGYEIHRDLIGSAYGEAWNDLWRIFRSSAHTALATNYSVEFYKGLYKGSTLPDEHRGSVGVPDDYFGLIYYDGTDDTIWYWHGGEYEINDTQRNIHINDAVKLFKQGNFFLAGVKLGTVCHAVQDIPAHKYNYLIKNNNVFNDGLLTKSEARSIFSNFVKTYNGTGAASQYLKVRVKYIKNRKGYILREKNATGKKYTWHSVIADNPHVGYVNKKWRFYDDYQMDNARYVDAKDRTIECVNKFVSLV